MMDLMPPPPPPPSSSTTSPSTFPILAITTLGILTTAILLLSYYILVIKCCLNFSSSGGLLHRLLSYPRHRSGRHMPPVTHTVAAELRGLEPAAIRSIPIVKFTKAAGAGAERRALFHECAVCLSEFEEEERIKLLPNCSHPFHIDCIDTWLQFNSKCPLCRSEVASVTDHILVLVPRQEQGESAVAEGRDDVGNATPRAAAPSPLRKKGRKLLLKVGSVGDECIDVSVGKDDHGDELRVQPMRRSISMDSSNDRQLYLSVQEFLRQNQHQTGSSGEGSSTSGSGGAGRAARRPFFSFSWSARSPILPI
ncbi:RING-H2 finger protein ATL16-like [Canna indica]|uniref:RING-type E3 ubiquitin transferase n=1 Tax=Canna indica TaxID=4628 RepID=A0AAQ3QFE4_9LILI|nr:RING-H2 finger protein ATL16-like [Canna indica]